jgi:hypothetical protein
MTTATTGKGEDMDAATATLTSDTFRRRTIARFFEAVSRRDFGTADGLLTADHVTEWPQSGERLVSPGGCLAAYASYPGGSPLFEVRRILGCGAHWSAELTADYGGRRVEVVSLIEFAGSRIGRKTDYFAEAFERPEWRRGISVVVDDGAEAGWDGTTE